MTNSIVKAFEDGAKEIGESAAKGATAYAGHVEEAGGILAKSGERHLTNDTDLGADMSKISTPKEDPSLPKSTSGSGSGGAASGAGADEEAAAKAAAEKAAADKAEAEKAAAIQGKIADLRTQGHAPQRHLDANEDQLKGRLGTPVMQGKKGAPPKPQISNGYVVSNKKMDPARPGALGMSDSDPLKYKDNYTTDKSGNPANHKCGNYSTAFGDAESMVKADSAARAKLPATPAPGNNREAVSLDAASTIGPEGMGNLRGKYIDPANPMTGTQVNYKDVNFTGSGILGIYDHDASSGKWNLVTMYPTPDDKVNP
jgi:hypothetical protein